MTVSLEREQWNKLLKIGDGIVLGVWAVTGTIKALNAGLLWPSAMLLGMITAVGDGMIRDITIGVVPAIFGGNTLYATSALLGSGMRCILIAFNFKPWVWWSQRRLPPSCPSSPTSKGGACPITPIGHQSL